MPKSKRLIIILIAVVVILVIPLIAMPFSDEIKWTLSDFIVAAMLLFGFGLMFDLILRKIKKRKYRIVLSVILLLALILIWAELAVGIFGSPLAGN